MSYYILYNIISYYSKLHLKTTGLFQQLRIDAEHLSIEKL